MHPTLGLPESKSQMASRLVQPFLYSSRQRVAILYNRPPLFSLKIVVSHGGSGSHLMHGSLVPSHPNVFQRHLNRFSRLCRAHGRESLYFTMGRPFLPLKLTLSKHVLPNISRSRYIAIATQPVHRLQIRPIVHKQHN